MEYKKLFLVKRSNVTQYPTGSSKPKAKPHLSLIHEFSEKRRKKRWICCEIVFYVFLLFKCTKQYGLHCHLGSFYSKHRAPYRNKIRLFQHFYIVSCKVLYSSTFIVENVSINQQTTNRKAHATRLNFKCNLVSRGAMANVERPPKF